MTEMETKKILSLVAAAYPNFQNGRDTQLTVAMWTRMFADETFQEVQAAFEAYLATDTKGFPPAIGALKERIVQFRNKDAMTEVEAWRLVSKAIKRGIYNSAEEFAKLPPIVQSVVGGHEMLREWAMMPLDEVETVVASNFQRSYKMRSGWYEDVQKLPSNLQSLIPAVGEMFKLPTAEEPRPALPDYTGIGQRSMAENLAESGIPQAAKEKIAKAFGIKMEDAI